MLVLHDHQRAGPQEPLPHPRRSRTLHQRALPTRHRAFLHHRRQFRAQPQLGAADRSPDRDARRARSEARLYDPGRHAVPPHPELYREGDAGRRAARLYRAGKHQPRQSADREKAPEQDHRIPRMLQQWRASGAITCAGYILRFPGDTKESILRDVEIIKRELPLDLLEFFFLTPLPGSEDHQKLAAQGVWMDPDLNKYDLNHRVSHHPKMSDGEWEEAYRAAWDSYYTPEHVRTILRRTAANPRGRIANTIGLLWWFRAMTRFEGRSE